jgi:hypothetical protein
MSMMMNIESNRRADVTVGVNTISPQFAEEFANPSDSCSWGRVDRDE